MKNKLDRVRAIVEKEVGLDLSAKDNHNDYVNARCIYFQIAKDLADYGWVYSLDKIGSSIEKHHSTVIHSTKHRFPKIMQRNEYRILYYKLKKQIVEEVTDCVIDGTESEVEMFETNRLLKLEIIKTKELYENEMGMFKRTQNLLLDKYRREIALLRKSTTFADDRFASMTYGLSDQQMEQVYQKLELLCKMMPKEQYA